MRGEGGKGKGEGRKEKALNLRLLPLCPSAPLPPDKQRILWALISCILVSDGCCVLN